MLETHFGLASSDESPVGDSLTKISVLPHVFLEGSWDVGLC